MWEQNGDGWKRGGRAKRSDCVCCFARSISSRLEGASRGGGPVQLCVSLSVVFCLARGSAAPRDNNALNQTKCSDQKRGAAGTRAACGARLHTHWACVQAPPPQNKGGASRASSSAATAQERKKSAPSWGDPFGREGGGQNAASRVSQLAVFLCVLKAAVSVWGCERVHSARVRKCLCGCVREEVCVCVGRIMPVSPGRGEQPSGKSR